MFQSIAFALSLIASTSLLSGCGQKELTPEQSKQFMGTLGNLSKGFVVVQAVSQQMAESTAQVPAENFFRNMVTAFASSTGGKRDQDAEEMAARLQKAVKDKSCRIPVRMKGFNEAVNASESFEFSIKGKGCPIDLSFKAKAEIKGDGERGIEFALHYTLNDKDLEELVDIKSWNLKGNLTVKAEVKSDSTTDPRVAMTLKGELDGELSSVVDGELKSYVRISGEQVLTKDGVESGKRELAVGIGYKDFTGEMKSVTEVIEGAEQKTRQFLNGKEMSEEEFEKIASNL